MPSTQSDWDAKHRLAAETPPSEPASIVRELLPLLPAGPALDIACGTGRHSLLLAARGQHVTAVDFSGAALNILEDRARSMHVPVRRSEMLHEAGRPSHRGIELMQADLERVRLPEVRYDLILCIQYLQRSLFSQMARALRPNGVLLFETYTRAQLEFAGGPRNPSYLLETGELREAFPELCVVFYRELRAEQGIASVVAKKQGKQS
jgi:tellurite methyltransferase